jgi:hypothetical protein
VREEGQALIGRWRRMMLCQKKRRRERDRERERERVPSMKTKTTADLNVWSFASLR